MTVPAETKIGNTAWYLVGKPEGSGACDHCGRALTHLYRVVNPDGEHLTVGRNCVKVLTGWTLSATQAARMLASAERVAEVDRRRIIVAAAYPEHAASYAALADACAAAKAAGYDMTSGYAQVTPETARKAALFSEATVTDCWWGGRGWSPFASWAEYLDTHTG